MKPERREAVAHDISWIELFGCDDPSAFVDVCFDEARVNRGIHLFIHKIFTC